MEKKVSLNRQKFSNSNRAFYLNVKQTVKGNNYLVITQAQKNKNGDIDRHSIVLFEDEVAPFAAAMTRSILMFNLTEKEDILEKEQAEEKRKEDIKKVHPNAFKKWSSAEEKLLTEFFKKGATVDELCVTLQRNEGGVLARLNKLGLMNEKELDNLVCEE